MPLKCGSTETGLRQDMSDSNRREQNIRVNESDLAALKAARDEIDPSLALGAVARMGARELMKQQEDDGVKF